MDIPINWDLIDSSVKQFGFDGEVKIAKVVSVYDGDTIKVVFPFLRKLYKFNCRIMGVDTPEIRTRDKKEKEYGIKVRDELRKKILNKVVKLKCGEFDKYGRLLVDIELSEEETIKNWLINNNYAFAYDGGTKKKWKVYLNTIAATNELSKLINEN
jgi:micrococcal nuclease